MYKQAANLAEIGKKRSFPTFGIFWSSNIVLQKIAFLQEIKTCEYSVTPWRPPSPWQQSSSGSSNLTSLPPPIPPAQGDPRAEEEQQEDPDWKARGWVSGQGTDTWGGNTCFENIFEELLNLFLYMGNNYNVVKGKGDRLLCFEIFPPPYLEISSKKSENSRHVLIFRSRFPSGLTVGPRVGPEELPTAAAGPAHASRSDVSRRRGIAAKILILL